MLTTSEHDCEINDELLDQTQAYLEFCSRGHDPPPHLVTAWDRFYDCYATRLRAVLARWDMTAAERDDCLQDVWVSVVVHLGQFQRDQGRACLSTWLTTVARNKAVDMLRRRRRHPADGLFGSVADALLDASPDPTANCVREEMQDQVRRVLAALSAQVSARNFQVFYQRRIENWTVSEIAIALGLTAEQVRLQDHRMMKRLRALFEQSTYQENHHL